MNSIEGEEGIIFIYEWIDSLILSRPKRNIARDFSDGVLLAEIIKQYLPSFVELHNYSAAHSMTQKLYNWNTLNTKVLKKLNLPLSKKEIEAIVTCQQGVIEQLLKRIYDKFNNQSYINFSSKPSRVKTNSSNSLGESDSKEIDYKDLLFHKDKRIKELTSQLNFLEAKVKNSEDENAKLKMKIEGLKNKMSSSIR